MRVVGVAVWVAVAESTAPHLVAPVAAGRGSSMNKEEEEEEEDVSTTANEAIQPMARPQQPVLDND